MAKTKTLEQLEADEAKLLEQLEAIRAGKKDVAKAEADEAKTTLQDALTAYNKLAASAGVGALRLVSDAERAVVSGKASGTKRLRLKDETRAEITQKIVKAAKAHKDGASKQDIIKYLETSGYTLGTNYNELHLFGILNTLRGGDEPAITTKGEKSSMRYFAA